MKRKEKIFKSSILPRKRLRKSRRSREKQFPRKMQPQTKPSKASRERMRSKRR